MLTRPNPKIPSRRSLAAERESNHSGLPNFVFIAASQIGNLRQYWTAVIACGIVAGFLGAGFAAIKRDHYVAAAAVLVGAPTDQTDVITARGDLETYGLKLHQLAA